MQSKRISGACAGIALWSFGGVAIAQLPPAPAPTVPEPTLAPEPSVVPSVPEPAVTDTPFPPAEELPPATPLPAATQSRDFFELPVTDATELPEIESPYTLGSGDQVQIDIFNVPEYSGTYTVSVDGQLSIPIVGQIDVRNLTIPQATEVLVQRFTPILQRPIITLSLASPRPLRVAIGGEAVRPGAYTFEAEGGRQFPLLSEAIEAAGGLTQAADAGAIQIRRFFQGQERIILVDLWELLQTGELAQDVTLRDGDRIVVPTLENLDLARKRRLAAASFAPESAAPLEVSVIGEVARRGPQSVEGGTPTRPVTVTTAITAAGGITNLADLRNVEVRRFTSAGEEQILPVDLWALLVEGDLRQDLILQTGDTVIVPSAGEPIPAEVETIATASFAPEEIQVNVIGETQGRGRITIPSNTPLSQAILAAGGFNNRAREGSVRLVRIQSDGTVLRERFEVDLDAPIDPENNPTLRNNDTIVVGRNVFAVVSDTIATILDPVGRVFSFSRVFTDFNDNFNF